MRFCVHTKKVCTQSVPKNVAIKRCVAMGIYANALG